jgi:hypothetical protein
VAVTSIRSANQRRKVSRLTRSWVRSSISSAISCHEVAGRRCSMSAASPVRQPDVYQLLKRTWLRHAD